MAIQEIKRHDLHQSILYRIPNRKCLAKILFSSDKGLEYLANEKRLYNTWNEEKKDGGFRLIEAPYDNLKNIQRRIADILQRITPPDYLMAPVKQRSYVHNAAQHIGATAFCLLDIEDFFPSCTYKKVFWFFSNIMQCPPDIASLLTKISTHEGRLPQGSPCSPILAYFAYMDMWQGIADIVISSGNTLSIYADDITISGSKIYGRDVWAIKKCLHRYGHSFNQRKERSIVNKPADITGVIVGKEKILLPNRQHRSLTELKRANPAVSLKSKTTVARQIRGRIAQSNQIMNHKI